VSHNLDSVESILFDLDGTLLDSISSLEKAFLSFLKQNGIDDTKLNFEDYAGHRIDQLVWELKQKFDLASDLQALIDQYDSLLAIHYFESEPIHSAVKLLYACTTNGVKTALVTSGTSKTAIPILQKLGWLNLFDQIVTGEQVKLTKPDPSIYALALQKLRCKPEAAIAIEDSITGISSASKANILTFGITNNPDLAHKMKEWGAAAIFSNLNDVYNHLVFKLSFDNFLKQIDDDFEIVVIDASTKIPASVQEESDKKWNLALKENPSLFNGVFLYCTGFDNKKLYCRIIPYSFYFASLKDTGLKEKLSINAVAVSGICRVQDKILIGKRGKSVTQQPGYYELVPSGGLDPNKRTPSGSIDFHCQLDTELFEETKISPSQIQDRKLMGLFLDSQHDVFDICVQIQFSPEVEQLNLDSMRTSEYDELLWLPINEIANFIRSEPRIIPTSLALLKGYLAN